MAAAALLTASITKFAESAVLKTDVNFLLAAYIFYRIVHSRSSDHLPFEDFVNKHHEWHYA